MRDVPAGSLGFHHHHCVLVGLLVVVVPIAVGAATSLLGLRSRPRRDFGVRPRYRGVHFALTFSYVVLVLTLDRMLFQMPPAQLAVIDSSLAARYGSHRLL